jgi:hypothetical protein
MAEPRQELRFPVPLMHSCQFAISRSALVSRSFLAAASVTKPLGMQSPVRIAILAIFDPRIGGVSTRRLILQEPTRDLLSCPEFGERTEAKTISAYEKEVGDDF